VLADANLLFRFVAQQDLPPRFGYRVDERIVEVPWVLVRLRQERRVLLDAGAAFNHDFLLDQPVLLVRRVVMCSISPERRLGADGVSYTCCDLRQPGFMSESFDEIVCVSTLEHVGMDNTRVYSRDVRLKECRPEDYLEAVRGFRRLLKHGGRLFLTVPYGRYENHGWLQQFDREGLERILREFGGRPTSVGFYKYLADGWQIVDADACADCRYFDIQDGEDYEPDYVAAARAVACAELVKG
jgi:SAM-dependent methyltransferase